MKRPAVSRRPVRAARAAHGGPHPGAVGHGCDGHEGRAADRGSCQCRRLWRDERRQQGGAAQRGLGVRPGDEVGVTQGPAGAGGRRLRGLPVRHRRCGPQRLAAQPHEVGRARVPDRPERARQGAEQRRRLDRCAERVVRVAKGHARHRNQARCTEAVRFMADRAVARPARRHAARASTPRHFPAARPRRAGECEIECAGAGAGGGAGQGSANALPHRAVDMLRRHEGKQPRGVGRHTERGRGVDAFTPAGGPRFCPGKANGEAGWRHRPLLQRRRLPAFWSYWRQ